MVRGICPLIHCICVKLFYLLSAPHQWPHFTACLFYCILMETKSNHFPLSFWFLCFNYTKLTHISVLQGPTDDSGRCNRHGVSE
jgi:hypothetical protein